MILHTAALVVESRKTSASRVTLAATVLLVAGIALLAGSLTGAAAAGNERVLAQLGPMADEEGWVRLTGVVAQITAAGGLLGFGVVLSWMFGREFADHTITGLLALPVSRPSIALAKLVVYLLWATAVAVLLVLLLTLTGLVVDLGPLDTDARSALARQLILTLLSALLAVPAAWASTLGRGLLPGIATTIGIIVIAQVMVVAGAGAWFPLAAPALWALEPTAVSATQLALVAAIPLAFGLLTLRAWHRLQLDR